MVLRKSQRFISLVTMQITTIAICLIALTSVQAADWANVRPMRKVLPILPTYEPKEGRIIGGSNATVGQFPYQVALVMDGSYFCGGSLISNTTVLSAAHCVDGFSTWVAHFGALEIRNEQEPGRVIVTTTDAQRHEEFAPVLYANDVAVLRLPQSVSGPNIGIVRLPSRSMVGLTFEGETARVSGWGLTSDSSFGVSPILKYTDVTVISNVDCAAAFGDLSVRNSTLCVDTNGGTSGPCSGDSGGPLVWLEADGIVTEIGIVSFGPDEGCQTGAPEGFARVTEYLDWIETYANGVTIRP